MMFSIALFILSLLLFVVFFAGKYAELRRGTVFFSLWRDRADEKARELKVLALEMQVRFENLPSLLWLLFRYGVHVSALFAARFARILEEKAHWLADYVSHKRGFERRDVRSEFLKKVGEVKNGNGKPSTNIR